MSGERLVAQHQSGAAAQGMMDLQVWLEGFESSCEQKVPKCQG